MENPKTFIQKTPHYSWVTGEENAKYLQKRYEVMKAHYMFDSMEFTQDISKMSAWFPLIAHNRNVNEVLAASKMERGTGVNFGNLTKKLLKELVPFWKQEIGEDFFKSKLAEVRKVLGLE